MGGARSDEVTTIKAERVEDLPASTFQLVVIEGPDEGRHLRLDGTAPARVLLGSSTACELRLSDPRVSRRHAALELRGRAIRITDLDSTNGTVVDGLVVRDAFLRGGEVVRVGGTALRVEQMPDEVVPSLSPRARFGSTVGSSPAMRRLYPLCERLAQSDVTVVIEGETGTGKEALAESLHEESPRRDGPFVVFDCTATAPTLIETELFGHERGAFSGAIQTHRGVFEQADGGTLLIDEIGDLDLRLQAKLLRVLQRREVRRLGSERSVPVDVRILAATRRDLDREVQAGRFRDDLFFRLMVARIELPPLRARDGDVPILAEHFWKVLGGGLEGIAYETMRRFEDYSWPGNIRELRNAVARLIALGSAGVEHRFVATTLEPRDMLEELLSLDLPFVQARAKLLEEFQRRYVERMLQKHGGNVRQAARASGIARRYFQLLKSRTRER